jgi:hypothetical protein
VSSTGVAQTRVYLPSLAAELPDGWTVSEGSVFTSPSGTEVRVELSRAPDDWAASNLIEEVSRRSQGELRDVEQISASTVDLRGGSSGLERRFRFTRDGTGTMGRIVCSVDGGLALTVSASWPVADGADGDDAMSVVLSSLRLLNRPVATVGAPLDTSPRDDPEQRAHRDPPDWAALRAVWSASSPTEAELRHRSRWSPEELAVCATVLGSPLFPTVGIEFLASLPELALDATLRTVTRSFLARDLIRANDDGSAVLVGDVGEMMDTAVYPDLTIMLERVGLTGSGAWYLGVGGNAAVQVALLPDGSRECGVLDPGCLFGHVLACATASADASGGPVLDSRVVASTVTLEEIFNATSPIASLVSVNTAWRVGEQVWGGVLTWAVGTDGSLWSTEQHQADGDAQMSWTLRAADVNAIRSELLEHLPGV